MKKPKKGDSWRREYIRLLTEPLTERMPEPSELERIEELIQAGYMNGEVIRDSVGIAGFVPGSPTLAGRLFAEDQKEILDEKTFWGRVKSGAGLFIGWLSGILSALITWYLTS